MTCKPDIVRKRTQFEIGQIAVPKGYERIHSDATTLEYYFPVGIAGGFKFLDSVTVSVALVVLSAAACAPKPIEIGQTPDRDGR